MPDTPGTAGPAAEGTGASRGVTASSLGGDAASAPARPHGTATDSKPPTGAAHSRGVRLIPSSRRSTYTSADEQEPYQHVRLLYRTRDQGVTAQSESAEERARRAQRCKTTGWQSRFATPYRPLGTPEPRLHGLLDEDHEHIKQGDGEVRSSAGEALRIGGSARGSARGQAARGALTARAMLESPHGHSDVTPSGRPADWLPQAELALEYFSRATKSNARTHHRLLLASVQASESRVKMVRAGQAAIGVLAEPEHGGASAAAQVAARAEAAGAPASPATQAVLSALESAEDQHPLERQRRERAAKGRARPAGVPALRLPAGLTGAPQSAAPSARSGAHTARSVLQTPGGLLGARPPAGEPKTGESRGGGGGPPASARPGTSGALSARGKMERRAQAMAGVHALAHPAPPMTLAAESFRDDVAALTARVHHEVRAQRTERLDTFRRKFKNFALGDMGSSADARLREMRMSARKEKLQNEIYLFQNRQWYTQLMHKVAEGESSEEQRELLRHISEMVEGGVTTKAAVHTLLRLVAERGAVAHFTSRPIQAVFEFLCTQFGVVGQEYDSWLEDHALPLPPATLARYEAARQKRLQLFQHGVVAKHWRQRLDMLGTTKALHEWFPDDVIDAVVDAARPAPPSPAAARAEPRLPADHPAAAARPPGAGAGARAPSGGGGAAGGLAGAAGDGGAAGEDGARPPAEAAPAPEPAPAAVAVADLSEPPPALGGAAAPPAAPAQA